MGATRPASVADRARRLLDGLGDELRAGLGPNRPAPAGILAFSGFVPVVDGWQPQLSRPTRVFIAHGRRDPVMEIGFAQRAHQLLQESGMDVD
jgi:phospholipase/carboxylesterase